MVRSDAVALITDRIAHFEGYFLTAKQAQQSRSKFPSTAQRNNNPGNIRSWGTRPVVSGYAQFPSAEEGFKALRSQVDRNVKRGLSFKEFFAGKPNVYGGFAPAADSNHPVQYATFVAAAFPGATIDTVIESLIDLGS